MKSVISRYFRRCGGRRVSKWMKCVSLNEPWFHCFQGWVFFQFLVRLKSPCWQKGANESNVVSRALQFQASWGRGKTLPSLSVALKRLAFGQKSSLTARSPNTNLQNSLLKLEDNWGCEEGNSYAGELCSRLIRCKIVVSMLGKHWKWCC